MAYPLYVYICGLVDMHENAINKIMKEEDWKEASVIGHLINEWLCATCIIYCPNVLNRNVKKDDRTEIFTKPNFRDKIQKLIQSIFLKKI